MKTPKTPVPAKPVAVSFAIRQVHTQKFAVHRFPNDLTDQEVKHQLELTFGWALEQDFCVVMIDSCLMHNEKSLVEIKVSCGFSFDKAGTVREGSQIVIPRNTALHLAAITYSTTRGVLHAKTENTPANQLFLPLANLENIIPEDVRFEIG